MNIGTLIATIGGDVTPLKGALGQANAALNKFSDQAEKNAEALKQQFRGLSTIGNSMKDLGGKMTLGLTVPLVAAAGASFKMASDLDENLNKTMVAFRGSGDEVVAWSKTTLKSFGIARSSALDMASLFGDMSTSMGLTGPEAAKMSTSLVGLAGDLASFKNIRTDMASTALKGIFTGETEALKGLGIVMTEDNLKAFAMSQGIKENIKDMTQAEKVNLRYAYVMANTTNAQGDFLRTGGGAANQMRIFSESLKEVGSQFGAIILPAITSVITSLNSMMAWIGDLTETQKKWVIGIGAVVAAVGPLLFGLGSIISNIIPKLITGWGAVIKVFGAVKNAMVLLNAAAMANPWMALAVVLVAVGTALYAISKHNKELSASQKTVNDVNIEAKKAIVDQKIATEQLLKVAGDETKGLGQRQEAIRKLNEISPEYFGNLTVETANSKEAQTACENYTRALENQALVKAAQDKIDKLRADNANAEIEGTKRQVTGWKKLGIQLTSFTSASVNSRLNKAGIEQEIQANKDYEDSIKALEKVKADAMAGLDADPIQKAKLEKEAAQKVLDDKKKNQTVSLGLLKDMEAELKKVQDLSGTFMTAEGEANNNQKINNLTQKIEDFKNKVANVGKTDLTFAMGIQDTSMQKIKAPEMDLGGRKTDVFGGLGADLTKIRTDFIKATDSTNIFSNALKSAQGVQIKPFDIGAIGAAKTFTNENDILTTSLQNIDKQLLSAGNSAKLYGETFDANTTKSELLKAEIDRLTKEGLPENKAAIEQLGAEYRDLSTQMANTAKLTVDIGAMMTDAMNSAFSSIGEGIGQMFAGTADAGDLFTNLLGVVADFCASLGKSLIAAGIGAIAFKKLLATPWLAVAAGVALVALSSFVKAKLSAGTSGSTDTSTVSAGELSSVPAYASGGIVSGNSFSGDSVLSRLNSGEMVLNQSQQRNLFDKLDSSSGNSGYPSEILLRVQNGELQAVLQLIEKRDRNLR
jgi:hypothetical protein